VTVTVQTSGGKPSGGFNYLQEYLILVTKKDFIPNPVRFAGGNTRSPFEGLTLATFTQTQRPNQTYPIFIDRKTMHIVGCGESLTDRIKNGRYTGNAADFKFDYSEAPEGAAALWPVSSKGGHCVWRLIATRLMDDWKKGYIKVSKNKSKANPNEYSVQYLPEGVIKKVENGELKVVGTEPNAPTLVFGDNHTVGSDIPTIWTEKDFFTTKGTAEIRDIFGGEKRFSYPKPISLVSEVIRACTKDEAYVLDFFAGSGTTGHAVLAMNDEENFNRKFILCTNNENDICRHVTYPRLVTVISGKREDGTQYSTGVQASLKFYKTSFVSITEKMYYEYADKLLLHIRELVELENGINFTGNAEIAIVLTDEELIDFIANIKSFNKCQLLYLGHDVLLSGAQEALLKKKDIQVKIIPDYYYQELEG
ncbi:MAG: DNA methyltransferase, partial [Oscillospiraceae bacterium]|nr:DNA methyltransferase [Oscillospiraceae bacterium]